MLDSAAAKFNLKVLQKVQKAFEQDPETDLLSIFPVEYSSRLRSRKKEEDQISSESAGSLQENLYDQLSSIPHPRGEAVIKFPLSITTKHILGLSDEIQSRDLTKALAETVRSSQIIWNSNFSSARYVVKCSPDIVIKVTPNHHEFTEYTSLRFLEVHLPRIPAPRPHGLITAGDSSYMFMSFIPGVDLSAIWPGLNSAQKYAISNELDGIFTALRELRPEDGMPLGGVAGEGCKDTRRHTWRFNIPVHDCAEFREAQLSGARAGSPVYFKFLLQLSSSIQATECVFSHGDMRTDNIIMELKENGEYVVNGLIDWEMSGFYPEDFECTKVTNTLTPSENNDWYLHLPACIAPGRYPLRWVLDRLWDTYIA